MTEEEKKAIAYLRFYSNDDKDEYFDKTFKIDKFFCKKILNLIEKLQKENVELKEKQLIDRAMIEDSISKGIVERDYIPKDKIREKIENYQNEIECENSYLEQGIICEEEYKDRVKVYNSYIFILNKLLEEEE